MAEIAAQPKVRIEIPQGEAIFTRVFLDGEELRYVTRVQFDTGDSNQQPWDRMARVTITLHADLELVGEPGVRCAGCGADLSAFPAGATAHVCPGVWPIDRP